MKTTRAYSNRRFVANFPFDVVDAKGRAIGADIHFEDCTVTEVGDDESGWPEGMRGYLPAGSYQAMTAQATRGGKPYGASQGRTFYATAKDRDDALAKYLKDARKRAQKTAAGK